MRKLAIAMALASTIVAGPAVAQDRGWYVGIEAGLLRAHGSEFDYHDRVSNRDDLMSVEHKLGWDADIIGGFDLGSVRLEVEVARKRASVDEIFFTDATLLSGDASGRALVTSAMGNALLDFNGGGWRGYLGGGAGIARVKYSGSSNTAAFGFSASDDALAWQVIAGASREITPNVEFGAKYRYFRSLALNYDVDNSANPLNPIDIEGARFTSHSVLASLIFNFRAAPPPPEPQVVAPPPPPPRASGDADLPGWVGDFDDGYVPSAAARSSASASRA